MFGSCSDFLKEYSQDKVYANNCTDLMELLIGSVYMTPTTGNTAISDVDSHFPFMFLMDDDVARYLGPGFFGTVTDSGEEYTGWYKWKKEPGYGETAKLKQDNAWFDLYSRIAVANTVLLEAERFPSDPL